jgi:hypothetical protein
MGKSIDELYAEAAASSGAPMSSGTEEVSRVYLGTNPTPSAPGVALHADTRDHTYRQRKTGAIIGEPAPWQAEYGQPYVKDRVQDVDSAVNLIYSWSAAERKKWEQTLLDAGLIKPGEYNFADLVQLWEGAVQGAGQLYTHGGKKVTPQQYVKNFLGMDGVGGGGGDKT